ncbi:MAG: ribulose-phosphate 3-epimerase [Candidatus Cloacimonadales bacterium]|nr:ribulose-phosphate 3-epimerase [Candidatus Cloacimonadales bacterium]
MVKIAPSLLSADFTNLEKEIIAVTEAGADMLHLDVMDGHFVPNLTFGLPIIKQICEISTLPLDVHLMVTNPAQYFVDLAKMGIRYISFHQETEFHIHRQLQTLKDLGVKAGVALNPATPVASIFPVLTDIDFVLLMSVNPGFGGQKFLPLVFDKIVNLRKQLEKIGHKIELEVDGGVNEENALTLISRGVNILVAGSYIFGSDNYKDRIENLR